MNQFYKIAMSDIDITLLIQLRNDTDDSRIQMLCDNLLNQIQENAESRIQISQHILSIIQGV